MLPKTRGAIAAGHPQTAEAGLEMFRLGGNAFDAAVAAVLAACVAEPTLTSLGGGGFLLAHPQIGSNILFDFFTQTPLRQRPSAEVDFYPVQVNFGSVLQEFHVGLGSIAVPGAVAGLWQVQQRLGRLPISVVAAPAIHYAKTGVEVGDFQAYCCKILQPILLGSPEARRLFTVDGQLPQAGAILTFPQLADTLSYLVAEGTRGFYQGEIAQQLVRDCQEQGGYLSLEDLSQYQVIERQPLSTFYRNRQVLTNPPPSSGGALIAFSLALLGQIDCETIELGSIQHLSLLAEVMRLTNTARRDGFDAHLYAPGVAERFLSSEHLSSYHQQLARGGWAAVAGQDGTGYADLSNADLSNADLVHLDDRSDHPGDCNKWGSTTHLSTIDAEGNAASVTTSNGEGSSYVIPGTGIMMNNMLGEADLHPQGFYQWQENVRISSMMAPTLILNHNRPEIVLGSGGSNRIRTAILQVISNLLDFHLPVTAAVHGPRVHWENSVFNLEPGFELQPANATQFPFDQQVEQWLQPNMFFGGVHAVTQTEAGALSGAGDPRRCGVVRMS